MSKEYRTRSFKSGNSIALRVPKALGVRDGTEMRVHEEGGRFVFEPIDEVPRKIDLTGIWGAGAGLKPLTDEERIMEPRQLDWGGKLLRGD
ncbi:MAG: AbrB/MazE/SpoVT family DNA-binding domain-containing protein [Pseudomonadota bacterium]